MNNKEVVSYNKIAWNEEVRRSNQWTVPVDSAAVDAARHGEWQVLLTPTRAVPREWFGGDIAGRRILCLASGGGQQGPLFAAAGADVTVFDNSPAQLARDRMVAERDGLAIRLEEGDMADLSRFADGSFDLIFHPVSNTFVPDVLPVWREAARVLRTGGRMLSGITSPYVYLFDEADLDAHNYVVKNPLPHCTLREYSPSEQASIRRGELVPGKCLEHSHTLQTQIGGQLDAGLALLGFFEDGWEDGSSLNKYFQTFMATLAVKLQEELCSGSLLMRKRICGK